MDYITKISKILRTDEAVIRDMEVKMDKVAGSTGVLRKIIDENNENVRKTLDILGLEQSSSGKEVYGALIRKLKESDKKLYYLFRKPDGTTNEGLKTLFNFTHEINNNITTWVLKKEIAAEILKNSPPPNILKALGYSTVQELLKKEDFWEVFSALRFVETKEWMHKTFGNAYSDLKPSDFEPRPVRTIVLGGKWLKIAEKFVEKKYHNVSHLKELGVIFVVPLKIDTPGETIRLFTLILHYFHELNFYSQLFKKYSLSSNFAENVISLLRGDVLDAPPSDGGKMNWLIVQRYLAKIDEKDPRLFVPHVNPEAIHWRKAEDDVSSISRKFADLDLGLWSDLDFVGDFFPDGKDNNLISFDLIDNVMTLVMEKQMIKYLYHQQEALWNRIFEGYMGFDYMESRIIEKIDKGYINL